MSEYRLQDLGFRSFIDASPDATVVVDPLGKIVAVNRAVERLLGWAEGELLSQPMNRLFPPRFHRILDTPHLGNDDSQATHPNGARVSLFARRRDGSESRSGDDS